MPAVYMGLKRTVDDCNRHFSTVIKDAKATFTSDSARGILDQWILLVIKAAKEIQDAYREPGFGMFLNQAY